MSSRGRARHFIDDEAGQSSERDRRPNKRQRSPLYDAELEDVSEIGDQDTEEGSEEDEDSGLEDLMDRGVSTSMSPGLRSLHDDEQSEEESVIQTPQRKARRAKLRAVADSASEEDQDERDSHHSISIDQSSISKPTPQKTDGRKKVYSQKKRVRRSTSPEERQFARVNFSHTARLHKWRPMAAEERILLTQRGGMIWQVAKPLLARIPEEKRGSTAKLLKMLMSSLDNRLSKTPIPSTTKMPKVATNSAAHDDSALARSRPMLSSLMSWVAETGGRIQRSDREGEADDPDQTMVNETPKGFAADIAILESMLLPEANEVVQLMSSLKEQKKRMGEASKFFDEVKKNAHKIDREADSGSRKVSSVVMFVVEWRALTDIS